ncbi:MAG: T9SS type A sorting domain-containing protein, partial [Saprospiraceae bacterium]|nr:T9SS type A sorting domain-containing protein [Saprospiraceae bacterium]
FIKDGKQVTGGNELYQNYPNPFDARTVIGLNLAEEGKGTLNLFDVTGRIIKSVQKSWTKGYQEVLIDRQDIGVSGVLYYRFESSFFTSSRKMVLIDEKN